MLNKDSADRKALRRYRLSRIREQLQQRGYAAVVFFDPINIRYATDTSNMQVWVLHNPVRYVFVPLEGSVVLFEELAHGAGYVCWLRIWWCVSSRIWV